MNLILREYVAMLREREELDALLPDLLASMNMEVVSLPQRGVRQGGVDIMAIGSDPEDRNERAVWLFVVKMGPIGRAQWDGDPQTVRPSLVETLEVFIPHRIIPMFSRLPIRIVVCLNDQVRQEVAENVASFFDKYTEPGKLEFQIWNLETLCSLVEKYLLNEYVLRSDNRALLRKAVALVGDNDYDMSHFYQLLESLLFAAQETPHTVKQKIRGIKKSFRTVNLCLNILYHWAQVEGNLRLVVLAAERCLLRGWDLLRRQPQPVTKAAVEDYERIVMSYRSIMASYFTKLRDHLSIKDGLFAGSLAEEPEYSLRVFEVIGQISMAGMVELNLSNGGKDANVLANVHGAADMLESVIAKNSISGSPRYDEHQIEVSLGFLLLLTASRREGARNWMHNLIRRIDFAFRFMGHHYPIKTDSYDDLVESVHSGKKEKFELMSLSTLLPTLAYWCLVFGWEEEYAELRESTRSTFEKTDLQIWYPDSNVENFIYQGNALRMCGLMNTGIELPENMQELIQIENKIAEHAYDSKNLSFVKNGLPVIGLFASRHFRTPVMPFYWLSLVT